MVRDDTLGLTAEEQTELDFAQDLQQQGILDSTSRQRARLSTIAKLAAALERPAAPVAVPATKRKPAARKKGKPEATADGGNAAAGAAAS